MSKSVDWYDQNAKRVAKEYESLDPSIVHNWIEHLLPKKSGMVLDVGAGSGRDAAWLAGKGLDVAAVEPSWKMRREAKERYPNKPICWFPDKLPDLKRVMRSGLSFDFILLSASWQHVPTEARKKAFGKLVSLLKPGGVIAITLRIGPKDTVRGIYEVSLDQIRKAARDHALYEVYCEECSDHLGRREIKWIQVALRAPDDGTGALPLLRHLILNDLKSSTYKLALLRALCRAADGSAGMATIGEKNVSVPLGLVALNWVRLYQPLLKADLPQSPENRRYSKLGFAKEPFERLAKESDLNLRVGMIHSGERMADLHSALGHAANTIKEMPVSHLHYPEGGQIFEVKKTNAGRCPGTIQLEKRYLSSFGVMLVPVHLWKAMQRFDAWIEPALVAEWGRKIKGYAESQGRTVTDRQISSNMTWHEPTREVRRAKKRAHELITKGELRCVWSDVRLSARNLDMDHCLPWAVWPCGDLWNLMPASSVTNRQKQAYLPSNDSLRKSQDRIMRWWDSAYTCAPGPMCDRFWVEARSTLPGGNQTGKKLPDVFDALMQQRMRLKHDQQIPEWSV